MWGKRISDTSAYNVRSTYRAAVYSTSCGAVPRNGTWGAPLCRCAPPNPSSRSPLKLTILDYNTLQRLFARLADPMPPWGSGGAACLATPKSWRGRPSAARITTFGMECHSSYLNTTLAYLAPLSLKTPWQRLEPHAF